MPGAEAGDGGRNSGKGRGRGMDTVRDRGTDEVSDWGKGKATGGERKAGHWAGAGAGIWAWIWAGTEKDWDMGRRQ